MDTRYKNPLYLQEWRKANREKIRQYRHARYLKHKESEIAYAVKWVSENYERFKIQRKAQSANLTYPGRLTTTDVVEIIKRSKLICYWCGKKNLKGRDVTIEHLKPINDPKYIVVACNACNAAKIPTFGPRKTIEEKREIKKVYNKNYHERKRNLL